jgi:hypothetical protein
MTLTNLQKEILGMMIPNRVHIKIELFNKLHYLNSSLNMFILNQRFFEDKCDGYYDYDFTLFDDIIDLFIKIRDCIEKLLKSNVFYECDVGDSRNCYTYSIPSNINNDLEYANHIKKSIIEQIEGIDKGFITQILIYYNKTELFEDMKVKLKNRILELEFNDITKSKDKFIPDE